MPVTELPVSVSWARAQMPLLTLLQERFSTQRPLAGARLAIVFHLSKEVANLALTLQQAGAEILLVPSKKATIEPDAHEALRAADITVEVPAEDGGPRPLASVLAFKPHLMIDNADLFTLWHNTDQPPPVIGSSVHSRSACMVLERHWEEKPEVLFPIIAVGASPLKLELESTFGTGQSVIDALIRVTGLQLSGKRIAVIGYGNVGSGIARFAKGLNARVSIVQNSAYRALKAVIDGYDVISLESALERSDIVLSATGATGVVRGEHFALLRDGAFLANVGRSREEIDVVALAEQASSVRRIDHNISEYVVAGKRIFLMGGGHQFNHIAGSANSPEIMDLSLAIHALAMEYFWTENRAMEPLIHLVPPSIQEAVSRLKLKQLGVEPFCEG